MPPDLAPAVAGRPGAPLRVLSIVGTRPEVIKMAPVIAALERHGDTFEQTLVTTGQHREMLDQVMGAFGLVPDVDLDLMRPDHSIGSFAARAMGALTDLFSNSAPDVVLIQGDTTTVLCAALAAFWLGIPLGHVEAGLRSHDRQQPFPEELNREVAGLAARYHFAPTARARGNLLAQGTRPEDVFVTGNTIVDALEMLELEDAFSEPSVADLPADVRIVLVTAHRRENQGTPMVAVCAAIRELVRRHHDVEVVFPVHLNPRVQSVVRHELADVPRVRLIPPLDYGDLLRMMRRSHLILTDSGGIQEEAPSFRKPVLVLRDVTERPEAVEAGMSELVGARTERIVAAADRLLGDPAAHASMCGDRNPFGDGRAGERIVGILAAQLAGTGELPEADATLAQRFAGSDRMAAASTSSSCSSAGSTPAAHS